MPNVRYTVPYEIAVNALDQASGKKVSNIFYIRSGVATGGPAPAYGAAIAGSDEVVMLGNFQALHLANIAPLMNANWKAQNCTIRAILGKQYKTPFTAILVLTPGTPINITTAAPHGLTTGQQVFVQGVTSPPTANGTWTVTVTSAYDFTLNGSSAALLWSGDGQWQIATGNYQYTYADKYVGNYAAVGGVVGDALPLFAAGSIRRLNTGTGRNFRSRISISPLSESDSLDGGLLPARIAAINTAFGLFNVSFSNGGTDPGAGFSFHIAASKKLAAMQPPIFTSYFSWTATVGNFLVQRNLGSLLRRKPKLTGVIT